MPKAGDILLYKDFKFEDGTSKDKLFVVLSDIQNVTVCLMLKTTSQTKRYANAKEGCNPILKVFFIPLDWKIGFPKDTYVQLPQIIQLNCLKQFKDDIAEVHWKMIFGSTS